MYLTYQYKRFKKLQTRFRYKKKIKKILRNLTYNRTSFK